MKKINFIFRLGGGDWCSECKSWSWVDDGCQRCGAGYENYLIKIW